MAGSNGNVARVGNDERMKLVLVWRNGQHMKMSSVVSSRISQLQCLAVIARNLRFLRSRRPFLWRRARLKKLAVKMSIKEMLKRKMYNLFWRVKKLSIRLFILLFYLFCVLVIANHAFGGVISAEISMAPLMVAARPVYNVLLCMSRVPASGSAVSKYPSAQTRVAARRRLWL